MPPENKSEPSRPAYNAQTTRDWSESRWASWYLSACDERERRSFDPLRLHPDSRVADEVEDLYIELLESSRSQIRGGLAQALRCWNRQHYSYEMLRRLCWIAAQIRAVESVPVLVQIMKDYRAVLFTGEEETIAAADDLISIMAGFIPDNQGRIETMFEDLLFDDWVEPSFAATLAVSISTANHEAFAHCFNRYCVLRGRVPSGYFSDTDVVAAFAEAVPKRVIESSVDSMTRSANEHWMRIGVRTKRRGSDEYVVPSGALVSIDSEGRSDITQYIWPVQKEANDFAQLATRYEIALDEVKTARSAAGEPAAEVRRSALMSVYALAA